ncbi:MAG: hypothetical protein HZC28_05635 [Spirochaetes bacterium]|nr:hypothetical protein [Spirochaetota bacterium]
MDADELKVLLEQRWDLGPVAVAPGEMSPRDRFFSIMDFKKPDRIIDTEFGYWNDTLKRWHAEGLPAYVKNNADADVFFGFDVWQKIIPVRNFIYPGFPEETVEETDRYRIYYDGTRVKAQVFKDGTDTIPHYLDFPVKDRESYLPIKERLALNLEKRFVWNETEWKTAAEKAKKRNYILGASGGSTFGWIRNLMGFEGLCYMLYDHMDVVLEFLDDLKKLEVGIAERIIKDFTVDIKVYWEDIAFKTGPIVPPDIFHKEAGAVYDAINKVYMKSGCRFGYVDCDGDMRKLVPTWLENGVNIMFPLEVAAGVHPVDLRTMYPGIRMMGGFDKVKLLEGKDSIRKELLRLKPLVEEGGFIPHVDHRVQADVSYENYRYYLEMKRDMFGLPGKVRG